MGNYKGIRSYPTVLFDFDGVLSNTNGLKSDCFRKVTAKWGERLSKDFVLWHQAHGGLSRYEKFTHFLRSAQTPNEHLGHELEILLNEFSLCVDKSLQVLPETTRILHEWRSALPDQIWGIVSGFDQKQLKDLIARLPSIEEKFFELGIHGSPRSKFEIAEQLSLSPGHSSPTIMFGDGSVDHKLALKMDYDFCFVSGWSEWDPTRDELSSFSLVIDSLDSLRQDLIVSG